MVKDGLKERGRVGRFAQRNPLCFATIHRADGTVRIRSLPNSPVTLVQRLLISRAVVAMGFLWVLGYFFMRNLGIVGFSCAALGGCVSNGRDRRISSSEIRSSKR